MTDNSLQKPGESENDGNAARVRELTRRFVEKTISESEADELLEIWERHPALFDAARNDLEMDYVLHFMNERRDILLSFMFEPERSRRLGDAWETATFDPARNDLSTWLERIALSGITFSRYTPRSGTDRTSKRQSSTFRLVGVVVLLVAVLSGVFLWNVPKSVIGPGNRERTIQPIAVLSDAADEQWASSTPPFAPGEPIFSGTLALESGLVELLFFNGTSVVLEGPADLTFLEPDKIFLRRGKISATVPPSGHGFETHTPHAVLTDLGTEFSVQVDPEQTATHVLKGLVAVAPNGKPGTLLKESNSLTARMNGVLDHISFDRLSFVSEALMRKASFDSPQNRQRRNAARHVPQMIPLLKSELDGSEAEMAPIRRNGGTLDAGRLENSLAFRFREREDYLGISVPQTLEAVTLAAWVCIDSLPQQGNPILMSRDERRGGITWQVNSSGSVSIGIRTKNRQLARNHESPILIGPERFGKWIHLAAVLDMKGRTISHYLDGRIVYTASVSETAPILIGEATIGNRIHRNTPIGHFHGRIDAIEIHDRALSPDELFNMYQDQKETNNE